jgi:hypothetical protein
MSYPTPTRYHLMSALRDTEYAREQVIQAEDELYRGSEDLVWAAHGLADALDDGTTGWDLIQDALGVERSEVAA